LADDLREASRGNGGRSRQHCCLYAAPAFPALARDHQFDPQALSA